MQSFLPTVKIVTTDDHMTWTSKTMPTDFLKFPKTNFWNFMSSQSFEVFDLLYLDQSEGSI